MLDEFRRFVEESILAYSIAVNSWLNAAPPKYITWPENMRYVPKDRASKIAEKVHASLGERDGSKRWLATSLLKTMKDNQRWRKGTELVDGFPEATSWLRERIQENRRENKSQAPKKSASR